MPRDTLACLQALDWPIHFIHVNGDRVLAAFLAGDDITEVPEAFRDTIAWTAQQLDANQRARNAWTCGAPCRRVARFFRNSVS